MFESVIRPILHNVLTAEQIGWIDNELADIDDGVEVAYSSAAWRALPGGNRTNEYATDSAFIDLGVRGEFEDISYDISFNYSQSERDNTILTGYPIEADFMDLLGSGELNVFTTPDQLTDTEIEKLQATMFRGMDTTTKTELMAINGSFSAPYSNYQLVMRTSVVVSITVKLLTRVVHQMTTKKQLSCSQTQILCLILTVKATVFS